MCLFDPDDRETTRHRLEPRGDGLFVSEITGVGAGHRYGLRAEGPWEPENGHRFDPSKLLIDPYAIRLDRPFHYDPRLGEKDVNTAAIMPKAIREVDDWASADAFHPKFRHHPVRRAVVPGDVGHEFSTLSEVPTLTGTLGL